MRGGQVEGRSVATAKVAIPLSTVFSSALLMAATATQVKAHGLQRDLTRSADRTEVAETSAVKEEVVSSRCGPAIPIHNREVCIARRVL